MSLNKCNLALVITLALNASQQEVEDAITGIREQFNGVNPGQVASTDSDDAGTGTVQPAGTLDGDGLPWDERIHSSNRKMTDKGKWVARRNVPDSTRAAVVAELKATMSATPTQGALPVTNIAPTIPSLPAPPAGAPAGLPPLPGANPAYTALVQFIAAQTNSPANPTGRLTDEWVKAWLAQCGVAEGSLQNLAHRPDLIPTVENGIKSALGIA